MPQNFTITFNQTGGSTVASGEITRIVQLAGNPAPNAVSASLTGLVVNGTIQDGAFGIWRVFARFRDANGCFSDEVGENVVLQPDNCEPPSIKSNNTPASVTEGGTLNALIELDGDAPFTVQTQPSGKPSWLSIVFDGATRITLSGTVPTDAPNVAFTLPVNNSCGNLDIPINILTPAGVAQQAQLAMTKTADKASVTGGNTGAADVTFTITLTNPANAQGAASAIQVQDLLPSGMTYQSHTASNGNAQYDSVTGLWNIAIIAPNQSATLTIVARANSVNSQTNITNTATLLSATNNATTVTPQSQSVTVNAAGGGGGGGGGGGALPSIGWAHTSSASSTIDDAVLREVLIDGQGVNITGLVNNPDFPLSSGNFNGVTLSFQEQYSDDGTTWNNGSMINHKFGKLQYTQNGNAMGTNTYSTTLTATTANGTNTRTLSLTSV